MPQTPPSDPLPPAQTVSNVARASLPGRVRVRWHVWARCFPGKAVWPLMLLLLAFALCALAVLIWISGGPVMFGVLFFAPALFPVLGLNQYMLKIKEHFIYGCVNRAVVVSMNPPLLAVSGDLTARRGDSWPVIKIIRQPLHRAPGPPLKVGDPVPTVALYRGRLNQPHWDDFFPIAVNCVTDDLQVLRDLLARLDAEEEGAWEMLKSRLEQVPTPYKPGLYWIRKPGPGLFSVPSEWRTPGL